jgi:hypothetical protein
MQRTINVRTYVHVLSFESRERSNVKTFNKFFENVVKFEYLGTVVRDQKFMSTLQIHNLLSEILKTEKLRKPKVFSRRSTPT